MTTTPEHYVQEKAAKSGSSFYYAFLFLPPPRRAAITAFYAFCREVDDVVDETSDVGVAATKLAWWRSEVAKAFAGQPSQHPVLQALMPHAPLYNITAAHLHAVIDGCEMDLQQSRYLDFPGLQRYCHLVAGIVSNPDDVTVKDKDLRRGRLLEVRVHPDDRGRVIGRGGRTAKALRTLVSALADGTRVRVDVADD